MSQILRAVSRAELSRLITDETARAFGWVPHGAMRRLMGPFLWPVANRFAGIGCTFDRMVIDHGFREACRWALGNFCEQVLHRLRGPIPRRGPLLVLSNHPGTVDALAIASRLPREDLKIIAADLRFLRGLKAASRHLIFASRDAFERMGTLRRALRQLQEGGALLVFPTGHLDPDPETLLDSHEGFRGWSGSLRLLLNKAPNTKLLLTAVSGVLNRSILHSPLLRLGETRLDRQRVAEFLQVMGQLILPRSLPIFPKITFDHAMDMWEFGDSDDETGIMDGLERRGRDLLRDHLGWLGQLGALRDGLEDLG